MNTEFRVKTVLSLIWIYALAGEDSWNSQLLRMEICSLLREWDDVQVAAKFDSRLEYQIDMVKVIGEKFSKSPFIHAAMLIPVLTYSDKNKFLALEPDYKYSFMFLDNEEHDHK